MTPEYIDELADMIDNSLWRLSGLDQMKLPPEMRKRLDAGVALRRHAADRRDLLAALEQGKSVCLTPLSPNGVRRRMIDTPPEQAKFPRLKPVGGLTHMEQLLAFCDVERQQNPTGKRHIAEWAYAEIERLNNELRSR